MFKCHGCGMTKKTYRQIIFHRNNCDHYKKLFWKGPCSKGEEE